MANARPLEVFGTEDLVEELMHRFRTVVVAAAGSSQDEDGTDDLIRWFSGSKMEAIGLMEIVRHEAITTTAKGFRRG